MAKDAYPGLTEDAVQWGPHDSVPIVALVDGRVEAYSFGTPLGTHRLTMISQEYRANWDALSEGWVCQAQPQQAMHVAVFWPNAPLTINGQRIGHFHYGHVRQDIKAGPVRQGEVFAYSWDSGIRWEPRLNTRAAHVHCCAGAGSVLSPNGDLDGRLAVLAQGWEATDVGTLPGPQDYESGRYVAGRLLTDFQRAGKPIPPMPA